MPPKTAKQVTTTAEARPDDFLARLLAVTHPYIILHVLIASVLMTWATTGIQVGMALAQLLPLCSTYVAIQLTVQTSSYVNLAWVSCRSCRNGVPVLAAFLFLIVVGLPLFYAALFYNNDQPFQAACLSAFAAIEVAFCLAQGCGKFMATLSCSKPGEMDRETFSAFRDYGRKAFGLFVGFFLVFAYYGGRAVLEHSHAVVQHKLDRQTFFLLARPIVLNDMDIVRKLDGISPRENVSDTEIECFMNSTARKDALTMEWVRLLREGEQLDGFSVWSAPLTSSASYTSNGTVAGFVDKFINDGGATQARASFVWVAMTAVWILVLSSKKKRTGDKAVETFVCLSLSILAVSICVILWEPLRCKSDELIIEFKSYWQWGAGSGAVALLGYIAKKYML